VNLIEADAKQILENNGLAVPAGRRLFQPGEVPTDLSGQLAVKAQVLAGCRGKSGLVRLADGGQEAAAALAAVRGVMAAGGHAPLVMIEDRLTIEREYYLAWRIDDAQRRYALMYSAHGGVEIEAHPESIRETSFTPLASPRLAEIAAFFHENGLRGRPLAAVARFALDLHAVMLREEALLVEINPLVVTPEGTAVALDAKVLLDENAERRHLDWRSLASWRLRAEANDPLERDASAQGITFVRLDGEVALLTGGAGLGMTLVDLLADAGHPAANFVDVPGGSGAEVFGALAKLAFRRASEPGVKAILMFLTLSATSLKAPVESILAVIDADPPPRPLIVGIVAGGSAERDMTLTEAQAAFAARGHVCVLQLEEAVAAAVAAIAASAP
jgi:succinyl-CoA synthetase beta subunit